MGETSNLVISIEENIRLVGTAHISKESVELVRNEIEQWNPDIVAVELCKSRHKALLEDRRLDKESLLKVIKEGKAPLIIAQSLLASEQRKLGLSEDMQPGAELIEALSIAKENEKEIALIDRDIQVTLRRAWRKMKFREKFRLLWSLVGDDESDEEFDVKEILENNQNGFYVDIGAFHPYRFSNTFYFYLRGWKGINVDATPNSMLLFEKVWD